MASIVTQDVWNQEVIQQEDRIHRVNKISLVSHGGVGAEGVGFSGSCHKIIIERINGEVDIIIVDIGLFQGKDANRNSLPFDINRVRAVIITHGHGDHCGRLPLLVKQAGFGAEVYMTPITREVAIINMQDTARIAQRAFDLDNRKKTATITQVNSAKRIVAAQDQKWVPRNTQWERIRGTGLRDTLPVDKTVGGFKKNLDHGGRAIHDVSAAKIEKSRALLDQHNMTATSPLPRELLVKKAQPLYTEKDIALLEKNHIHTVDYRDETEIAPGITLEFYNAGHVPGSALAFLRITTGKDESYRILMSGDLGRVDGNFHPYGLPEIPLKEPIDAIVHETTYGGTIHIDLSESIYALGTAIRDAYTAGKKAFIIPALSLERTPAILHHLLTLREQVYFQGKIELDSPLAESYLPATLKAAIDDEFIAHLKDKKAVKFVRHTDPKTGKKLPAQTAAELTANQRGFKVIVAGSGMANGGYILDYLKKFGGSDEYVFGFTCYQGEGTLGRELTDGKKLVTVDGLQVEVRAKILHFAGFSAHADEKGLEKIFKYGYRNRIPNPNGNETQKLVLIHGDTEWSTLAYAHRLERASEDGKKGIPTVDNIHIQGLSTPTILFSRK